MLSVNLQITRMLADVVDKEEKDIEVVLTTISYVIRWPHVVFLLPI